MALWNSTKVVDDWIWAARFWDRTLTSSWLWLSSDRRPEKAQSIYRYIVDRLLKLEEWAATPKQKWWIQWKVCRRNPIRKMIRKVESPMLELGQWTSSAPWGSSWRTNKLCLQEAITTDLVRKLHDSEGALDFVRVPYIFADWSFVPNFLRTIIL